MGIYLTCTDYIKCATSTQDKIEKINQIIDALEDSILEGALKANIEEYSLNDGQTTIKTVFRDISSIETAITALERRKNRLINKCVGYRYGLQDGKVQI
jgi:hypothetical protein